MKIPIAMRLIAALLALFLAGCLPYDGTKTVTMDGVERAGYFIGTGFFWLGAFVCAAAFLHACFAPRK